MQWRHSVGWKQIFEKVEGGDEQPSGIHSDCIQQGTHSHTSQTKGKNQETRTKNWSITRIFPWSWEVTPSPKGCPQPQASLQGHPTSLWGYKGSGVPTFSSW